MSNLIRRKASSFLPELDPLRVVKREALVAVGGGISRKAGGGDGNDAEVTAFLSKPPTAGAADCSPTVNIVLRSKGQAFEGGFWRLWPRNSTYFLSNQASGHFLHPVK